MAAAKSIASALDLTVDDAVVLHDSNKLALRLLPCDVLARVAHVGQEVAQFEVELAQRLAETESPVAALEPRVEPRAYERDGFVVTLWTYYESVAPPEVSPADYANALERLHAGMRTLDISAPHFTDRVAEAQQLVASRDRTPALADADRELLSNTLRSLRRAIEDAAPPSSCCTASRIRATCSARRTGCGSSTSRRVAVGLSNSTSPMCPKRSASAIRTLIKNCSASAGSSFSRWSQRGAGIQATSSRTGNEPRENSSAPCARVHRGRRSTS